MNFEPILPGEDEDNDAFFLKGAFQQARRPPPAPKQAASQKSSFVLR